MDGVSQPPAGDGWVGIRVWLKLGALDASEGA
jgi:hypothetical protein